jgi:glycosyltransferase involved in cell wall biosynthesis
VNSYGTGEADKPKPNRRKPKVVRVVTASYVVSWHLANTLKRMPADFEVCVVGQGVSEHSGAFPDIKFIDIGIYRKVNITRDISALFALSRFIRSYRPDIVHSIMPKAGLLAAIAGFVCRVPVRLHTFTGQTWAEKTGLPRYFYCLLDRLVNYLNTVCLTDSFSQSAFLLENGISYAGKALPVLSRGSLSGVDTERFDMARLRGPAEQLRNALGLKQEHFIFAFIARKTRDKGAIDVLKAFASVAATCPEARLLFIGPDEDGEIERLHRTNPEWFANVIEIGHVSNHELYLAITNVLCLPSHREGFGSIVIDAAALGVPAIGSRIAGLVDAIVDGQTGVLFPDGDLDDLARIMREFIGNQQLRRSMGDYARDRVDKYFTADLHYQALKKFYLEHVERGHADGRKRAGRQ